MTEALGVLFFNSGVFRWCLVDHYWKVVDIERAAVRGSRHGGYRLQRYEEVCSEITEESTRYEIFKGHVDFYTANARNLSFSLKVTEFFDQQNSEVGVPECRLQAQQCLGVAACESTVTAR